VVEPGETVLLTCTVEGHTGVSRITLDIHYVAWPLSPDADQHTYGRSLSLPFNITVQPSLRLAHIGFKDIDRDHFELSFLATNAHSRQLGVRLELRHEPAKGAESEYDAPEREQLAVLSPAQSERMRARVNRELWRWGGRAETLAEVWKRLWKRVDVNWDEWADGYASGYANIAAMSVSPQQLEIAVGSVLRLDHHYVSKGMAVVGSFVRIRLTMHNCRGEASPPLLVRLAGDAVVGMREHRVETVLRGETRAAVFTVCPAEAGRLYLAATVVPVDVLAVGAAAWMSSRVVEIDVA